MWTYVLLHVRSTLFKVKLTSEVPCPTCRTMTPFSKICKPNLQIITHLRDLVVACSDCNKSISLEEMAGYTCQGNQSGIEPTITTQGILSSPPLSNENVSISKNPTFVHHPPKPSEVHNTTNHSYQENTQYQSQCLLSSTPLLLKKAADKSLDVPVPSTPLRQSAIDQIKEILDKHIDSPLTNIEERVLTHTFKCKLYQTQNDIIQLRTGGQPSSVQRIIRARKRSSVIYSPLKRKSK